MNMDFIEDTTGCRTSTGPTGREWRIYHVLSGWRLEFHDPGDLTQTGAGLYGSVEAAMREAARDTARRRAPGWGRETTGAAER